MTERQTEGETRQAVPEKGAEMRKLEMRQKRRKGADGGDRRS